MIGPDQQFARVERLLQERQHGRSFLRMVTGCAMRYSNSSPTASAEAPATMELGLAMSCAVFTVSSDLHRRLPVPPWTA